VHDVAKAAGVAVGSVSRVLNESGYASADLRQRVHDAVARLGYQPDYTARHRRTQHSKTIGYLLPNIANPHLAVHLSEVERLLQLEGYSLLVGTSEHPERDRELLNFFENRRLEGVIASPMTEYRDPATCPFANCKLPVVLVDRDLTHPFDSVLVEHRLGLRQAVKYLLTLGHRRIALFVSSAALRPGREKLIGYKESLEEAGLPFDERIVFMPDSWLESSKAHMAEILNFDQPPTSLIAIGTQLLSGAVHVACKMGLAIPEDLSVIGIGTADTMDLMYPPVTALRYDFQRSAMAAVRLIVERINGVAPTGVRHVQIASELIIGESCAIARKR